MFSVQREPTYISRKGCEFVKKAYEKPCLISEDLFPEEMLCGCAIENPNMNEVYCNL